MEEDWRRDLEVWLAPFVSALRHKARKRLCPAHIAGLIGPGDRKSIQPMADRDDEVRYDQLHHFVSDGVWDSAPLEATLLREADRLVGDETAYLVIDDTALPKKGRHSVGVGAQYASSLGKTSNCQSLVSSTLASGEVPVMVGLRLFLPESWTDDPERMERARVPTERQVALTKPEIAIEEIDRVIASGVRAERGELDPDHDVGAHTARREAQRKRDRAGQTAIGGRAQQAGIFEGADCPGRRVCVRKTTGTVRLERAAQIEQDRGKRAMRQPAFGAALGPECAGDLG